MSDDFSIPINPSLYGRIKALAFLIGQDKTDFIHDALRLALPGARATSRPPSVLQDPQPEPRIPDPTFGPKPSKYNHRQHHNPDPTLFPGMIEAAAAHKTFAKRSNCTLEEAAAFQAILVANLIGGVIDKPQPLSDTQARFIILNTHRNLIHVFSPADCQRQC